MAPPAPMAPSAHTSLPDHDVTLVTVQDPSEDGSEEEENDVHDAEGEGGLQHGTIFVDISCPVRIALDAKVSEGAKIDIDRAGVEVCAVGAADSAELVDTGDEGAKEAEVNQGDEGG